MPEPRTFTRVFLDSAPLIYFTERHPVFAALAEPYFDLIDSRAVSAVVSAVTLAECLVLPLRTGNGPLQTEFQRVMLSNPAVTFVGVDASMAREAAAFSARYALKLLDAIQVAAAVRTGCDLILTNDLTLRRVREVQVTVLSTLLPPPRADVAPETAVAVDAPDASP